MHNPFAEDSDPNPPDEELVRLARGGSRDALERLIRRHQGWVYNVVVRMLWRTDRAEDLTQEVLVKIVTGLASFRGDSRFRTWAYRIACNHALNAGRSEMEAKGVTFTDMGRELAGQPDRDLPDPRSVPADLPVLVAEARVGCTTAMLMCLDRRQRLAFTLGEVFGVTDRVGGELLGVAPDHFRQLLARARRDLYQFMAGNCGLVNPDNPCRCARKAAGFVEKGYLDPRRMQFTPGRAARVRDVAPSRLHELDALADRLHAEVFRDHPFLPVPDQVAALRRLLAGPPPAWVGGDAAD
jgi:RNA polymerase sigma factor (sigma-70 family)